MMQIFTMIWFLLLSGLALAQGEIEALAPKAPPPSGCLQDMEGKMWISGLGPVDGNDHVNMVKRSESCSPGYTVVTLHNGVLTDAAGRTGSIVGNHQFQFDGPVQAGAIFTSGFSVCGNGSLAIGDSTNFYGCKSGDYWNIYDADWAPQCQLVKIGVFPCNDSVDGPEVPGISQMSDGQVVATSFVTSTIITQLSDGQPQIHTTAVPIPICQIPDGQVQIRTTPCESLTFATPTGIPISQLPDGQPLIPAGTADTTDTADLTSLEPFVETSTTSDSESITPPTAPTPTDSEIPPTSTAPVEIPTETTPAQSGSRKLDAGAFGMLIVGAAAGLAVVASSLFT